MKSFTLLLCAALFAGGCKNAVEVDKTPPLPPQGIRTISLNNSVQLNWLANQESDVKGYNVWVSDAYNGQYTKIGTTVTPTFVDLGAVNGTTYFYAVSCFDASNNESAFSKDVVYDTPRPEGTVTVYDYQAQPLVSGYDFSTNSIGPYSDQFTDFYFGTISGVNYLLVPSDTKIQDMGYSADLDEISASPSFGWAPSGSAEAIPGHSYVFYTWDNHYAKVRIVNVSSSALQVDWAYQTAVNNPELNIHKGKTAGGQLAAQTIAH